MSEKDENAISTEYLNDAFGWEGKEHVVQHDIGEAMKIIFDTLQRALSQTAYEKEMNELFKYKANNLGASRAGTRLVATAQLQKIDWKIFMGSMFRFKTSQALDNQCSAI